VIDGIRNTGEIAFLRDRFGYHFTLLGIVPTFKARWDRIGASLYKDDREGQRAFFADDDRDQNEEIEHGQQVRQCIDLARIIREQTAGSYFAGARAA
jgi:hypothetical protein